MQHMAGPTERPTEQQQCRGEAPGQHFDKNTFVRVDSRKSSGSARSPFPDGEPLRRSQTERMVQTCCMAHRERKAL